MSRNMMVSKDAEPQTFHGDDWEKDERLFVSR